MPALHKIKGELQTIRRGYKLLYSIDRDVILYKALRALIAVISPYTTLYFTSQLINGIAAKQAFGHLMGYAVFIVGINLILSVLNRIVSRKVNIADQNIWYSISLYFNSVNMKMQYEHLENPETHLKRDRIFQAQNANGFGVMLLSWKVEAFVNAAASIILSAALTVSLFTLKAPGEYAGLWALFNSPFSVLIILALLCLNLITSIRITGKSSAVFHKEIKNLAEDNRVAFFYREHIDNYESAAEIRIFNEAPLIQKSWLNDMLHPAYLTNIVRATFAGIFCFPAGKAGRQTPLEAPGARKQGKIRKNSGNCVKNCSSYFLFGLDCGILFNGILSKPIATAGRHAKAPDLCRTHKRNAALSGDGHRVFPVWALRPAENTEQEGYTLVRGRV